MKWTSNKGWLEVFLKSFIALISMCFIVSLPKLIVFNQTVGFHLQYYLQSVIVCLSLVPMFLLSRMVITLVEEESDKDYILFGKAKGLSSLELFSRHIFRNLMRAMVRYFNVIYWSMLSSLFIIEYLFEMGGFTKILYRTNE